MTRFCRAFFFGVGMDHGESPPSSANNDELVRVFTGSSPNKDFELIGADSVGEDPNSDMMIYLCAKFGSCKEGTDRGTSRLARDGATCA